jgi:ATPase subunit of ABC transporter with duplicated ATPase domains
MAAPLLQLGGITLTLGGTPLLDGVDLAVAAGERVCLVGRNGSGKSTLLKIAARLVEPDNGNYRHQRLECRQLSHYGQRAHRQQRQCGRVGE